MSHDDLVAAGGALLGTPLSAPADLGGGMRCTVLRCRTAGGGTVVLKKFADRPDALACFTAEAAGLQLTRHGPEVLAVDPATALRARYDRGGEPSDADDWIGTGIAALPAVLDELGVRGDAGIELRLDEFPVFSPGDICPDNNLLYPDGMRVLDFEGAGYHPVFLDAAYLTMPFATCWCVFRLPPAVVSDVDAAYRSRVTAVYPELADDRVWSDGLGRAVAAWTVDATVAVGARAAGGDQPLHPRRTPVPTIRTLLRHRWQVLAATPGLPAFADLAERLLAATDGWGVEPLPLYPAFSVHGRR